MSLYDKDAYRRKLLAARQHLALKKLGKKWTAAKGSEFRPREPARAIISYTYGPPPVLEAYTFFDAVSGQVAASGPVVVSVPQGLRLVKS